MWYDQCSCEIGDFDRGLPFLFVHGIRVLKPHKNVVMFQIAMDSVQLRMEIFHALRHLVKDPLRGELEIAN